METHIRKRGSSFYLSLLSVAFIGTAATTFHGGTCMGVDINVYFELKCPDCHQWLHKQLIPLLDAVGEEALITMNVHLNIVPFGNAVELVKRNSYEIECQHGAEECYLNRVVACGMEAIGRNSLQEQIEWLKCVDEKAAFPISQNEIRLQEDGRIPEEAKLLDKALKVVASGDEEKTEPVMDKIYELFAIVYHGWPPRSRFGPYSKAEKWLTCDFKNYPWSLVKQMSTLACVYGPAGDELMHRMALQTGQHDHVPWVEIQGVHVAEAETDLKLAFCNVIRSLDVPLNVQTWCGNWEDQKTYRTPIPYY